MIDVVVCDASGEQRRLIVQCKKYDKEVGKEVLDTLVGVRAQMGDVDLAVVTTVGYTRGARDVAHDESVLMLRLRPYEPAEDDGAFVREVVITIIPFQAPVVTSFNLEVTSIEGSVENGEYATNTVLERDDGFEPRLSRNSCTPTSTPLGSANLSATSFPRSPDGFLRKQAVRVLVR